MCRGSALISRAQEPGCRHLFAARWPAGSRTKLILLRVHSALRHLSHFSPAPTRDAQWLHRKARDLLVQSRSPGRESHERLPRGWTASAAWALHGSATAESQGPKVQGEGRGSRVEGVGTEAAGVGSILHSTEVFSRLWTEQKEQPGGGGGG